MMLSAVPVNADFTSGHLEKVPIEEPVHGVKPTASVSGKNHDDVTLPCLDGPLSLTQVVDAINAVVAHPDASTIKSDMFKRILGYVQGGG